MKTLLQIRASLFGPEGQSSRLADQLIRKWRRENPDGRVVTRDLLPGAIPGLTAARYRAFNTPAERRTPEPDRRQGADRRARARCGGGIETALVERP